MRCSEWREVYAVGGAQAVALLAYGDPSADITPVELITGPGNVYVAAAKRLVRGVVAVDAEAGPTEIAVLADRTADPVHVAADLISQAEHDVLAASVLVTDSVALADAVDVELVRQVELTKHVERIRAALSGEQSATVLVRDLEQGLEVVDGYAAEHLEVITADARRVAERVRNAGCVFVGPHAPVSLGDYCAGSNHVLPTGGAASACVRPVGADVPQGCAPRRVRLRGARRGCAARAGARGRRGPARARRRRLRPAATVSAAPNVGTARATADVSLSELPLRDELRGAQPYGAPQHDVPVRLNTNENPYPPSATVAREIGEAGARVGPIAEPLPGPRGPRAARGPRRLSRPRTACVGDLGGQRLERGHAAPAAGLRRARPHRRLVRPDLLDVSRVRARHALALGGRSSAATTSASTPTHAVGLIEKLQPAVVLLASPNNPTGTALPLDVIEPSARSAPGMVVVDEAYAEFRRAGTPSALRLLAAQPRLVVTRTMSKAFAFAGGRLGYLAAAPAVVDALRIVRLPYHLSAVTQAVARVALAHAGELLARSPSCARGATRPVAWLRGQGLPAADSDANFVLFGVFADRHAVWQGLLDRGVLIRELGPDGWLRVSIGTERGDGRVPHRTGGGTSMTRIGRIERQTSETKVLVEIDLDGVGRTDVSTGVGFYDHMLDLVRQARAVRPHRPGRGRPAHRRAPHRRGHRDRARPGVRAGGRRQGRHPPVRRRVHARWTRPGAGRGRPVRPSLPRAPRAGRARRRPSGRTTPRR